MVYRNIDYYNLDMIISVGFRVNSRQGILFELMLNTTADGKKYHTKSNNLDVIILSDTI